MDNVWPSIAACAGIVSLSPVLLRLRLGVRGTALESAWPCAATVWFAWLIVTGLTVTDRFGDSSSLHAWIDVLWYLAAILALTPPVAVLGARRPTARVWTAFVLIPLVLVFAWPVLPTLRSSGGLVAFTLETPLLVGFALVLVMGAGNYIGLRFSPSALLWIAGLLLVVLPLCPATSGWVLQTEPGRTLGTLCLVAAAWLADRQAAGGTPIVPVAGASLDCVWRDFRDLFGIVWARRIQERFNDEARQQGLPLRLGIDGLEDAMGSSPAAFDRQSFAAAEASLRWLLQKFVDRDWIDRRLSSARVS
jgi:hypothetical protein